MAIKDLGRWESLEMLQRYTRSVCYLPRQPKVLQSAAVLNRASENYARNERG